MTLSELQGSLAGIGLPELVRLLARLGKTGRLRVCQGGRCGELTFSRGRVAGATFGAERGLAALDAILLALPRGRFTFAPCAAPAERGLEMSAAALERHAAAVAGTHRHLAATILSLDAVPRRPAGAPVAPGSPPGGGRGADEVVRIDREALRTALAVDGRRSVAEIAAQRGLADTVADLALLADLRVITFAPLAPVSPPAIVAPPASAAVPPDPAPETERQAPPSAPPGPPLWAPSLGRLRPRGVPRGVPAGAAGWLPTGALATVLLVVVGLTWSQQARPYPAATPVETAVSSLAAPPAVPTPPSPPDPVPLPTPEPALEDAMRRLAEGLRERDGAALAALADPGGVLASPYSPAAPDGGYPVRDAAAALQALLVEGDPLPLAWQPSGEGAVIVATAGWRSEVFLPAEGVSLEMTPMVAFRLVRHEGEWYWRWFMPDVSGTLNRQRRDPGWRTLPG